MIFTLANDHFIVRPSSVTLTFNLPEQMFQLHFYSSYWSCNNYVSLNARGLDKKDVAAVFNKEPLFGTELFILFIDNNPVFREYVSICVCFIPFSFWGCDVEFDFLIPVIAYLFTFHACCLCESCSAVDSAKYQYLIPLPEIANFSTKYFILRSYTIIILCFVYLYGR